MFRLVVSGVCRLTALVTVCTITRFPPNMSEAEKLLFDTCRDWTTTVPFVLISSSSKRWLNKGARSESKWFAQSSCAQFDCSCNACSVVIKRSESVLHGPWSCLRNGGKGRERASLAGMCWPADGYQVIRRLSASRAIKLGITIHVRPELGSSATAIHVQPTCSDACK